MEQVQLDERHEAAPTPPGRRGLLGEAQHAPPIAIADLRGSDLGDGQPVRADDAQVDAVRPGGARSEPHGQRARRPGLAGPSHEPALQERRRCLDGDEMLVMGGRGTHRLGAGGPTGRGGQGGVQASPADEHLRGPIGRLAQAQSPLQPGQGEHAVALELGGELLCGEAVHLVAAVGDEVEDEAESAKLLGEVPHLFVAQARGVPIERRREVVGEHRVRVLGVDGFGESARIGEVRGLGLHPQQVRERCRSEGARDRVVDAPADPVVPVGGPRQLRIPVRLETEIQRLVAGHQPGSGRPGVGVDSVQPLDRGADVPIPGRAHGRSPDLVQDADRLQPGDGSAVVRVGHGEQQVAAGIVQARLVEELQDGEVADSVARHAPAGGAEQEGRIALVAAVVEQGGGLGVRARHDDAGHAHQVELEARGVQPLELFVLRHQHLAVLVAALLGARALVLDVIPGHADLDESPDQVADVGIAPVAGVGVGDDERPEVYGRGRSALGLGHPAAREVLVAIGGQERAHDARGLVRHGTQRVTGKVRARVLMGRALGRGGPAAKVDRLEPLALLGHRLARRVRPEGRDRTTGGEPLAKQRMEPDGRLPGHAVVGLDGALLFGDVARGVQSRDAREAGFGHPRARLCHARREGSIGIRRDGVGETGRVVGGAHGADVQSGGHDSPTRSRGRARRSPDTHSRRTTRTTKMTRMARMARTGGAGSADATRPDRGASPAGSRRR